jgi:hypothetical protein
MGKNVPKGNPPFNMLAEIPIVGRLDNMSTSKLWRCS